MHIIKFEPLDRLDLQIEMYKGRVVPGKDICPMVIRTPFEIILDQPNVASFPCVGYPSLYFFKINFTFILYFKIRARRLLIEVGRGKKPLLLIQVFPPTIGLTVKEKDESR